VVGGHSCSLVFNASILLTSVAIFASEGTDNSIDKSPPLEAIGCEFLGFLGLGVGPKAHHSSFDDD